MSTVKCPKCAFEFVPRHVLRNPVKIMRAAVAERSNGLSATGMAAKLGVSQPYLSNLLLIHDRVDRAVRKMWEESWNDADGPRVTVHDMRALGAKSLPASKQRAEYDLLVETARLKKQHSSEKHSLPRRKSKRRRPAVKARARLARARKARKAK